VNQRIISAIVAFLLSLGLALPAAAEAATPIDWGHALKGGLIAAGLWIVANLLGHLWIRSRKARENRTKE
jgi:hypothetical protein